MQAYRLVLGSWAVAVATRGLQLVCTGYLLASVCDMCIAHVTSSTKH
jgi:hypothetical protein